MALVQSSMVANTSSCWMPSWATGWSNCTKIVHHLQHSTHPVESSDGCGYCLVSQLTQMSSMKDLTQFIKMVSDVTDLADDILAKGDSEINHDKAVISLPETA